MSTHESILESLGIHSLDPAVLFTIISVVIGTAFLISFFSIHKKKIALKSEEYIKFKLIEKVDLTHDTRKFRFTLQSNSHILGLPIGQHISFKMTDSDGKMVTRSYTPTSSNDEIGYVEFVIKVYFPNVHPKFPDGGKMSYYLEKLTLGSSVEMRGPKGSLEYKGDGLFSIKRRNDRKVSKIGMIAGGTGITPMLQIMNAIRKEKQSTIELSLLFANQTEKDILLREDIEQFTDRYPNFKYHFTLDRPPENWKFSSGFVTQQMINEHLPKAADDVLVLLCGPPPMVKFAGIENLQKLKFTEEMYFSF